MTYIGLDSVSVRLPVYDGATRLIRLPSSLRAKVGSSMGSQRCSAVVIRALNDISLELRMAAGSAWSAITVRARRLLLRLLAGKWPKQNLAARIAGIEEFSELDEYLSLPTRVFLGDIDHANIRRGVTA
jgi:hypothetical protein